MAPIQPTDRTPRRPKKHRQIFPSSHQRAGGIPLEGARAPVIPRHGFFDVEHCGRGRVGVHGGSKGFRQEFAVVVELGEEDDGDVAGCWAVMWIVG